VRPTETIEYALRFAVPLSPWWLVVLLPLAAATGWALYRIQFRSVARKHAAALLGLRIGLMMFLVFLAFRPSLVRRKVLTYDGRILLVWDDSESMGAKDNAIADAEALRLRRALSGGSAEGAAYHQLARTLLAVETEIRRFQRFSRTTDRTQDVFWEEAGKVRSRVNEQFRRFKELCNVAAELDEENQKLFAAIRDETEPLRQGTEVFFSGNASPGRKAFDRFCKGAEDLAGRLLALQAVQDRRDIARGNAPLRAAADEVRARSRIDLLSEKLAHVRGSLGDLLRQPQFFQFVSLTAGTQASDSEFDPKGMQTAPGATDIVGRLEALAGEKSDFPLTAIVLLSDGRDLSGRSAAALEQGLSRKQVPVYAGGAGFAREPIDVAILDLIAPPFAAKNTPVNVKLILKTSLAAAAAGRVDILKGAEKVASQEVELGGGDRQTVTVRFTPKQVGVFRYTARVQSVPGETFPLRNNTVDFVVNVREEKAKVLLLDWKPRWETRFALNIFRRLDYIDLNPIVVLTTEGATPERGVQKGTWPENLATLEMYDLVVLGDLPPGMLTEREWNDLRTFVEEKGKAVCFIGSGRRDPVPALGGLREALLPIRPRADEAATRPDPDGPDPYDRSEDLRLAAPGRFHPVTRLLAGTVKDVERVSVPRAHPDTQVLLVGKEDAAPLVSCRFVGRGKTFLFDTDRLWKALNPTAISAHAQIYISMLTWAVEGGYGGPPPEEGKPALAVDRRAFTAEHGMQVWAIGAPEGTVVQAFAGDRLLAEAPLTPDREGAAILRAEFTALPPANVVFRWKQDPGVTTGEVIIVQDYPELKYLSRDDEFLRELAEGTGGEFRDLADLERFFLAMRPKKDVRPEESVWRMWDAATILALLAIVLTVEWVYRKLVGLV